MNIENFEHRLYSLPSNMSNDSVIKFIINFHRIYPWLLFPFGFIGSLLTILIFTRKKFQKFGCSILFVAESFMDLLLITLNCVNLILRYTFQSTFFQRSIYTDRAYKFLTNYFSHCAVWILCVISLERAAVTKRYVWKKNVFSRKHSYCTLIIVYIILFFLNMHYLMFFNSKTHNNNEIMNDGTTNTVGFMLGINSNPATNNDTYLHFLTYYFSWIDFIINSLIPFIIILIANTSVMYSVCKSHIVMKSLGGRQTRSPRETQLAYILFVSTFLFLLLTFPIRVFSVIEPYLHYEKKYLILLDGIMRFLLYVDHGCGFYLYTFTGELFRRELRKFLYECLHKSLRRRYFNWTYIESRRQSELSYSNGGGVGAAGGSHTYHQTQHANIALKDSISSCTVGGTVNTVKLSLHSLQTHRTNQDIFYHQCVIEKAYLKNGLSISSSRSKLSGSKGKTDCVSSDQKQGLVKRHSSSCFESEYKPLTVACTSHDIPTKFDFDRKSDIV